MRIILMKRWLALLLALALLPALAGCSGTGRTDDGRPIVAAAFYPLAWLAERVGGDDVQVRSLTKPGVEPHDLELSVRQMLDISDAALVVYERGFQPSVDAGIDLNAEGRVLDAAPVVHLEQLDGQPDPHFWQDPARMATLAQRIGRELARIDPAHRRAYLSRAADVTAELLTLDREYAEALASCTHDTLVVSHDAFGYLAKYGLDVHGIVGLSPDAEPTPAAISELKDLIRTQGVTTVYGETLASPRIAETLAREAGVAVGVLDPIEGLSDQTRDEDYLTLMRANLATIEKGSDC
jgi:zinc transport system substrate-binding protein